MHRVMQVAEGRSQRVREHGAWQGALTVGCKHRMGAVPAFLPRRPGRPAALLSKRPSAMGTDKGARKGRDLALGTGRCQVTCAWPCDPQVTPCPGR